MGFILAALAVLGGCGWAAVAPFRARLSYPWLVAPMAGALCVVTGTLALYAVLDLRLILAGAITVGVMLAGSTAMLWLDRPVLSRVQAVVTLVAVLLTAGLAVKWGMAASVNTGGPAIVYWDGTDHLGYAHLADWMNGHPVNKGAKVDPSRPYESWPALLFQIDPRFGSFAFLGLVSAVTGESGAFAYEPALALLQVAAVLALAGAFARSPLTLGILIFGLLTCHWFDYGRTGFFGKSFGYPAIFLVTILLIATLTEAEICLSRVLALAGLVIGAALAYSGVATAFFIGVIGGGFLLVLAVRRGGDAGRGHWGALVQRGVLVLLLGTIAIAAGTTLGRPLPTGSPDWGVGWGYILPRIAEMESQGMTLSGLSAGALLAGSWISFAGWLWLCGIAVARWEKEAMAMLLAPLGLLAVFYWADARAETFQLIGVFYPLALLGFVRLFDAMRDRTCNRQAVPGLASITLVVVLAIVGLHQFRFAGAVARYGGAKTPPGALFTKAEVEKLVAFIGSDKAEVDVANPVPAIFLLVELGRRRTDLQWSPDAWRTLFAYRLWRHPEYAEPAKWRIVAANTPGVPAEQVALKGTQYWVLPR